MSPGAFASRSRRFPICSVRPSSIGGSWRHRSSRTELSSSRTPRAASTPVDETPREAPLGASLPGAELRAKRRGVQLGQHLRQYRYDRVCVIGNDGSAHLAAAAGDAHGAVRRHRAADRRQHRLPQHGWLSARRQGCSLCAQRAFRRLALAVLDDPEHLALARASRRRGTWYTPSIDAQGRLYAGVANPYPLGGTAAHPNGGAYAGPGALHRLAARAQRPDGGARLVRPGDAPRRSRLRLPAAAGPRERRGTALPL